MVHAWSISVGLSGVRWPLAKTHLCVIMGNLHFKKSWIQVTAVDQKLFFNVLNICSSNITFEGYWKNSSSCDDIDPGSSHTNPESSHIDKSLFWQGPHESWQSEVHISGMCYTIYSFVATCHTLCSAKRDLRYLSLHVRTGSCSENVNWNMQA